MRGDCRRIALLPLLTILLSVCTARCGRSESKEELKDLRPSATSPTQQKHERHLVSAKNRAAALRSAQLWNEPRKPLTDVDLTSNPSGPGSFDESAVVECRLVLKAMSGTTPKFDCELPGGDVVRVKYGRGNPELHAEVAASRLLSALGFGADLMYVVQQVRCTGCTAYPFHSLRCLEDTGLKRACFPRGLTSDNVVDFDHVVIERRLQGRPIEATPDQGWAWYELDLIDPEAGGASRAHVDALKLLAIFIGHWDNKAENQRLLCLPGADRSDGGCERAFAIVQDLGASFGPVKLDLHNWRSTGVWVDPRACRISMDSLPFGGGTFPAQQVSEEGRRFLLDRLEQFSDAQIRDLFEGARVQMSEGVSAEGRQPQAWAAAFQDKVRQIRDAGPCD